jgi:hypothetical protein
MRCPTTAYIYIITEVNPYWISTYRFLWVCMLFLCCLYVSYRFRSIQAASFRQKSPSSPPWASSLTESSDEMLRHKQKLPFQHIPNLANLRLIYANHNLAKPESHNREGCWNTEKHTSRKLNQSPVAWTWVSILAVYIVFLGDCPVLLSHVVSNLIAWSPSTPLSKLAQSALLFCLQHPADVQAVLPRVHVDAAGRSTKAHFMTQPRLCWDSSHLLNFRWIYGLIILDSRLGLTDATMPTTHRPPRPLRCHEIHSFVTFVTFVTSIFPTWPPFVSGHPLLD